MRESKGKTEKYRKRMLYKRIGDHAIRQFCDLFNSETEAWNKRTSLKGKISRALNLMIVYIESQEDNKNEDNS